MSSLPYKLSSEALDKIHSLEFLDAASEKQVYTDGKKAYGIMYARPNGHYIQRRIMFQNMLADINPKLFPLSIEYWGYVPVFVSELVEIVSLKNMTDFQRKFYTVLHKIRFWDHESFSDSVEALGAYDLEGFMKSEVVVDFLSSMENLYQILPKEWGLSGDVWDENFGWRSPESPVLFDVLNPIQRRQYRNHNSLQSATRCVTVREL